MGELDPKANRDDVTRFGRWKVEPFVGRIGRCDLDTQAIAYREPDDWIGDGVVNPGRDYQLHFFPNWGLVEDFSSKRIEADPQNFSAFGADSNTTRGGGFLL